MKRWTASIASAALAVSALAVAPQPAAAQANDEVSFCRLLVDAEVFSSVGECVGLFRSNPAKRCQNYASDPFLSLLGFKNRGDCVSFFRSFN